MSQALISGLVVALGHVASQAVISGLFEKLKNQTILGIFSKMSIVFLNYCFYVCFFVNRKVFTIFGVRAQNQVAD